MRKMNLPLITGFLLAALASSLQVQATAQNLAASKTDSSIVYQNWHDVQRQRDIPVKIYLPKTGTAPFPVVIFSHGLGGSREAAVYFGEYLAEHGYLGVFVQHAGSDSGVWQPVVSQGREVLIQRMKSAANAENLFDRVKDIKFVVDELEKRDKNDSLLAHKLDLSKLAIAGHSFGAGTALAIAGQRFGQGGKTFDAKDERFKAAIYLSPPVSETLSPEQAYGAIQIPGLLLTGTEDVSPIRATKAEDRKIPFNGMSAHNQYFVNFVGADHSTFGGRSFRAPKPSDEKFHVMIDEVSTKFLDAVLKNDEVAKKWLNSNEVTTYLGTSAAFEKK